MSSISFHVRNFGIQTDGRFTRLQGTINFDFLQPTKARFDVKVDAATVNTDNNLRDSHLRGPDFFDVAQFPVISFVSHDITPLGGNGSYRITGHLMIKGHTKALSFPFTYKAEGELFRFIGSFKINRNDFGIRASSVISDSVSVDLNIVTQK